MSARPTTRRCGRGAVAVLDHDDGMQRRIEAVFHEIVTSPRPAVGPSRDEMMGLVSGAAEERSLTPTIDD